MKITKELLRRHSVGLCSEEEKQAVEEWFKTKDDSFIDLSIVDDDEFEGGEKKIWSRLSQTIPELLSKEGRSAIPLYHRVVRYGAAACIVFTAFFGGRFSVGSAQATPVEDQFPKNHLFIFGIEDTRGHLPGDKFEIEFDGKIKLFNGAISPKSISVGDTSFILQSYQTYYLDGTLEKPKLTNKQDFQEDLYTNEKLTGDFSILRLDVK